MPVEQRVADLRADTACGDPTAPATSGLDGEPAGWCAVQPRTAHPRLRGHRVPWAGRAEDPDDDGMWAVTCASTSEDPRQPMSATMAPAPGVLLQE